MAGWPRVLSIKRCVWPKQVTGWDNAGRDMGWAEAAAGEARTKDLL